MLELRAVEAAYGDLQVLRGISMRVAAGSITALIGSNGAGKTSTLKTISNVLPLIHGSIELDGQPTTGIAAHQLARLGIAHVPEGRLLFREMTVLENLELGSLAPEAKKRRRSTLDYVLGLFPRLAERRMQLAGTLSGGEQQMLAIGRGLMSRPKLLTLDEPSLGLAPLISEQILETIQQIRHDGTTILLVEQDVQVALDISDYAYVLEQGRIVTQGPAKELAVDAAIKQAYMGI